MKLKSWNFTTLSLILASGLASAPAFAASQGINSSGPNLPIGAGGTTEITVNAPPPGSPAGTPGTVNFAGPIVEGSTTINTDGSTTVGSNNGTQPALSVNGEVKVGNTGASCSSSNEGELQYDSSNHVMDYCNGTKWVSVTLIADEQVIVDSTNPNAYGYGPESTVTPLTNSDGSTGTQVSTISKQPHELCALGAVQFGTVLIDSSIAHNHACDVSENSDGTWTLVTLSQYSGDEVNCAMNCYN